MPIEITIDGVRARGLNDLAKQFERFSVDMADAAQRAMLKAAYLAHAEVIREIGEVDPFPPVDTGAGRAAFVVRPIPGGAALENEMEHMVWMEEGTRPHWPPYAPIRAWAERKLRGGGGGLKKGYKGPRRPRRSKAEKDRQVERLTRGTMASIAKRGTKPRHFWKRASAKFPEIVERCVREELNKVR